MPASNNIAENNRSNSLTKQIQWVTYNSVTNKIAGLAFHYITGTKTVRLISNYLVQKYVLIQSSIWLVGWFFCTWWLYWAGQLHFYYMKVIHKSQNCSNHAPELQLLLNDRPYPRDIYQLWKAALFSLTKNLCSCQPLLWAAGVTKPSQEKRHNCNSVVTWKADRYL